MNLLDRLFRQSGRTNADRPILTVYTREHCGCCHKAVDLLRAFQRRHGFVIEIVDIDDDPALVEQHGRSVPVVAINGKIRFRGVVNPAFLERLLKAEAR